MSVAGAVAAAIRNTNYNSDLFSTGARLVLDFLGTKTGRPFYALNNRVYPNIQSMPGYSFSRASEAVAEGLVDDRVTNKVTCWSANPTEAAGFVGNPVNMAKTGDAAAVLSVVDDSAALAIAGLSGVCTSGKVYKLDNSAGGGSAFVVISGISNPNTHTFSAWMRGFGSGGGALGLGNAVGSPTASYGRITGNNTGITTNLAVRANAGAVIYFILPQLIERPTAIAQDIITLGATASTSVGKVDGLIPFATGVPAITSRGLSVWESRTNSLRNSTATNGAVVGVVGSGGALPTNWGHAGGNTAGLAVQVVSVGSEYGLTYVDVRYSGAASGPSFELIFESSSAIAASAAQVWTSSHYLRMVGGSIANVISTYSQIDVPGAASGGTGVGALPSTTFSRQALTLTLGAGATNVRSGVGVNITNGAAVDITLRVYGPQLELGAFVTPPIVTAGAAATRAADNLAITNIQDILGQFRTNKVTGYSANPVNESGFIGTPVGMTKTGDPAAVLSVVEDVTALNTAGLSGLCTSGKVYKMDNSLGVSTAAALFPGAVGSTGLHTTSAYLRGTGTACVTVSGVIPTTSLATTEYTRYSTVSQTPSNTSNTFAVRVSAGAIIYFILPQLEDGVSVTAPIVTAGTLVTVGNYNIIEAEVTVGAAQGLQRLISIYSNISNRIILSRDPSDRIETYQVAGGVIQTPSLTTGYSGARTIKAALRIGANDYRTSLSGTLSSSTSAVGPTLLNQISIGYTQVGTAGYLNGYVQHIVIYGDTSDSQLTRLTQ